MVWHRRLYGAAQAVIWWGGPVHFSVSPVQSGHWILDFGSWILDFGSRILDFDWTSTGLSLDNFCS